MSPLLLIVSRDNCSRGMSQADHAIVAKLSQLLIRAFGAIVCPNVPSRQTIGVILGILSLVVKNQTNPSRIA